MRSLLDTESKRQREGGGRRESPKPGSLYKVQSWLNWGTQRDGRDSYLRCRPLSSVGAKGTESGGKGGQLRRPFHPDYYFLRNRRWSHAFRTP